MKTKLVALLLGLAVSLPYLYAQTGSISSSATVKKSGIMKTFIVLVKVPVSYTPAQAKEVHPKWRKALNQWKSDGVYITSFAFPGESLVADSADKKGSLKTVTGDGRRLVSNILLRAETLEQATAIAGICPVLEYGGAIEVREVPEGIPALQ